MWCVARFPAGCMRAVGLAEVGVWQDRQRGGDRRCAPAGRTDEGDAVRDEPGPVIPGPQGGTRDPLAHGKPGARKWIPDQRCALSGMTG